MTSGKKDRELLGYAAYLHDVGDFISFTNHHAHSYYIIRNADLLGFDLREVVIMANLARYHRKRAPRRKDPELAALDSRTLHSIIVMSAFLRLAEGLDRTHGGLVDEASLRREGKKAVLELKSESDTSLEIWGLETAGKAFRRAFSLELEVRVNDGKE